MKNGTRSGSPDNGFRFLLDKALAGGADGGQGFAVEGFGQPDKGRGVRGAGGLEAGVHGQLRQPDIHGPQRHVGDGELSERGAADEVRAASGALVPIATIVRPMISSEIPNFLAKPEAPSTKKSAPFIRNINPTISSAVFLASSIASSSFPVALKAFGSAPAGLRPCRMPVSNSCISGLSYRCPMPSCTRTFHFPRIQTVTAATPVII